MSFPDNPVMKNPLSVNSSRLLLMSSALAGVAAFALAPCIAYAQNGTTTAEPPASSSTLDLTLDTGTPPTPPPTVLRTLTGNASKGPPVVAPPAVRRTVAAPLASRGFATTRTAYRQAPVAAPSRVLAQLGLVPAPLTIRVERDAASRPLSAVPTGTYLAVVADGGAWWGVLMVNNTMGWVPKASLQMIDYQTEVPVPSNPLTAQNTASNGAAGTVSGGVGEPGMSSRSVALLREAMTYLGVPYVWAGNTRSGLDCSGFLKAVFASQGVSLPRHSGDQAQVGQAVQGPDVRPGDRLYFDMGRKGAVSHCGIYLGNGYFIHASTNHKRVDIDSVFKPNYYKALVAIRRS